MHTITKSMRSAVLAGLCLTAPAVAETAPEDLLIRANAGDGTAPDTVAGMDWLIRAANNNGHRLTGDDSARAVSAYQIATGTIMPAPTTGCN